MNWHLVSDFSNLVMYKLTYLNNAYTGKMFNFYYYSASPQYFKNEYNLLIFYYSIYVLLEELQVRHTCFTEKDYCSTFVH